MVYSQQQDSEALIADKKKEPEVEVHDGPTGIDIEES